MSAPACKIDDLDKDSYAFLCAVVEGWIEQTELGREMLLQFNNDLARTRDAIFGLLEKGLVKIQCRSGPDDDTEMYSIFPVIPTGLVN